MVAPYIDACTILPLSRSDGKKTRVFIPALAPWAATAPIRLPVDGQARVLNSNSRALVAVTATGLSLKEYVGLTPSFLT